MDTQQQAAVVKTITAFPPAVLLESIHIFPAAGRAQVGVVFGKLDGQFAPTGRVNLDIAEPEYTAVVDAVAAMEPGENLLDPIWATVASKLGITLE